MFIPAEFHLRIANDRLDELRRHADHRRQVRLSRRSGSAAGRFGDVRIAFRPTPTPESPPCAVVSLDTTRPAAGRAA